MAAAEAMQSPHNWGAAGDMLVGDRPVAVKQAGDMPAADSLAVVPAESRDKRTTAPR